MTNSKKRSAKSPSLTDTTVQPNPDLRSLLETLAARHQALYASLDTASDLTMANATLTEMQEVLHRLNLVQGLLFRESTESLTKHVAKVTEADAELTQAMADAQKAADVISGVSKFLGQVDKAIDFAKTLPSLAVNL